MPESRHADVQVNSQGRDTGHARNANTGVGNRLTAVLLEITFRQNSHKYIAGHGLAISDVVGVL